MKQNCKEICYEFAMDFCCGLRKMRHLLLFAQGQKKAFFRRQNLKSVDFIHY